MKTGRWDSTGDELMTVKDRHKRDYVLSPVSKSRYLFMGYFFCGLYLYTNIFFSTLDS